MDTFTALSVVALAAIIHTSFQLSVSVVTLLSSHTVGKGATPQKAFRLVGAFLGGTVVTTFLIVCTLLYLATTMDIWQQPSNLWTIVCTLLIGIGVAIWVLYYRRGTGTPLWIPRPFARFLTNRVRTTSLSVEAFSLGMTTVIAELPFMAAPVIASTLALAYLPTHLQLAAALGYVLVASGSMIVVTILIGSGHNLSHIQRWREANKRFLQFAAGSGLIILGFFLYVSQVVATSSAVAGIQ